jgi:hypothetical protein
VQIFGSWITTPGVTTGGSEAGRPAWRSSSKRAAGTGLLSRLGCEVGASRDGRYDNVRSVYDAPSGIATIWERAKRLKVHCVNYASWSKQGGGEQTAEGEARDGVVETPQESVISLGARGCSDGNAAGRRSHERPTAGPGPPE